jgi:hypothetical protein
MATQSRHASGGHLGSETSWRSAARLRFRAAIKSITGDGVETARGSIVTPFIFASISCCNAS